MSPRLAPLGAAFAPESDLPLGSTTDTTWTDAAGGPGSVYKLAAEDVHGNRSDFAVAGSSSPVGVGPRPLTLALAGPWPNPSRSGVFSVSVTHPFARVTFEVFDVKGTRVFSRGLESDGPGVHAFTAGAERRLAPGLYLVRVTSGLEVREAKTVVVP